VIVVAVIVAVLALVAVQLYQGYVASSRRATAENLAAAAAGYLHSIVNAHDIPTATGMGDLDGGQTWSIDLDGSPMTTGDQPSFTCPPTGSIWITGNAVRAEVSSAVSTTYPFY
jgi:type II secretory pathway pseudopilin PulG